MITSGFPYGNGESFVEGEIEHLNDFFSKVVIISHNVNSENKRKLNNDFNIHRIKYGLSTFQKLISIFHLLNPLFWKEFKLIIKSPKANLSIGIIKTILISLHNAKNLRKKYSRVISEYNSEHNKNYCYSYWSNDSAIALAMLKIKHKEFICFSRIHGWDVFFETSKFSYLPCRNFISNNLNSIFSISKFGLDYCLKNWEISLPFSIRLSRLGVKQQNYLANTSRDFTIVSCSNLIYLKRIDLLINSLSHIKINLKWIHFGDGELFNLLKNMAIKLLPKNINYEFKGAVPNSQILDYYKNNSPSLIINLSNSEGIPVSIMEAFSFGIPAIATNVGGISEIVNDKNGFLLDANPSSKEVANVIEGFYNLKRNFKESKRKAAYKTWSKEYNADNNYAKFVEDILSL